MENRQLNFADKLKQAITRRRVLIEGNTTQAMRIFSGTADGVDGIFIDFYGSGATLIVYEGRAPRSFDANVEAATILETLKPLGVKAIYLKPFAKDRSRLGGELPAVVTDRTPLIGEPLPESILIREHDWNLEIRLYDGLSTGLFLDQRDNRAFIANQVKRRGPIEVLNTFAYTCAFSVAAAKHGAMATSVDISPRYLDWGKRNFQHNDIDPQQHRWVKMDTFEYFNYARRKNLKYDIIILDPPSFSAGSKKKGIRPWSSVADYAKLVAEAAGLLKRGGMIFASTNTQELCRPGRLDKEITKGIGRTPKWVDLPESPIDFARDAERFSARAFTI